MIKILKADEPSERQQYFTGLTCGRSRQPSALPFEVRVPHGFLLGFYKCNSLLAPSMQTMWATCQSDGTRTGRFFSAPLDKESCWQATAERQRHVCPFEAQRTLKEQHKQIRVQQQGPSRNYWRCNVLLIMIQTEEFFSFTASSDGSSLVDFKNIHVCTYLIWQSQGLINNGVFTWINVCSASADIIQWFSVGSLWGRLIYLFQTPKA